MAEEDLCLLLNPKRYFLRGRRPENILDCLLEPQMYEAFIQNSIFYPEDLHEFHLNFATLVNEFKAINQGNLSREFVVDNLPNIMFVLSKTIHHRIPEDILPLLGILAEFANVHNLTNDIPNLRKLVHLFKEQSAYMKIFFDEVKGRVSKTLLPIYRQMEEQESQGYKMIGKSHQQTNRLKLQILEKDLSSTQFIARSIAPMQLIVKSQKNTLTNALKQNLEQQELEIAQLSIDNKCCKFNQRYQSQIVQLTNDKRDLQTQNIKILTELQKSRQKIKELSSQMQKLPRQWPLVSEPQFFPIKVIGTEGSNGLFEYDGQQFRRAYTLEFQISGSPECVQLRDSSLFVCGGEDEDNTCIITPHNQVRQIAKMNKLRCKSAIVKLNERIYTFGGSNINIGGNFYLARGEIYTDSNKYSALGISQHCAEAEYYDINLNMWTNIQPLPDARSRCGAVYYNGSIYVGGGYCRDSSKHQKILRYDINSDTYTPTNMTVPLKKFFGTSLFLVGNTLYSVSGQQIISYNIDTQQYIGSIDTLDYVWWICMPPLVLADTVILALTFRANQLVRLNYKTGEVNILGDLNQQQFQVSEP